MNEFLAPRREHAGAEVLPHPSTVHGELQYRFQQQAIVADLGEQALKGIDLDVLFDRAVERVASVLNNEYCKVLELLPGGDFVFLRAGVGWREGLVRTAKVDIGLNSQAGFTLASKEPVIVKDLRSETRFNGPSLLIEHGVVSGMSVIIHGQDGPWGVLGTHTKRYHEFTQDDINFFQAVANILANAIQRKRAESLLQEAAETLEIRVQQRTKELATAKAELQELTRIVSHELQGPLRLITSHQALFSSRYQGTLGSDADNFLSVMGTASKKIERMIDDLWIYARVDSPTNHPIRVDLNQICDSVIANLNNEFEACGAQIVRSELPAVSAVPTQVEYLLNQILRNALVFCRDTTQLKVTISAQRQENGFYTFTVSDNGIGFDMMDAQNVFKMFHRLQGDEFPGTGMGLAIAKKIVEISGGSIWIQSETGLGTKVYFTLPAA